MVFQQLTKFNVCFPLLTLKFCITFKSFFFDNFRLIICQKIKTEKFDDRLLFMNENRLLKVKLSRLRNDFQHSIGSSQFNMAKFSKIK